MNKENKQFLKDTLIIIIIGILINAACFFIGSFSSKAASNTYYPVQNTDDNGVFTLSDEQLINYCNSIYTLPDYIDPGYCILSVVLNDSPTARSYRILMWDKAVYNQNPFYIEVSSQGYFEFHVSSNVQGLSYRTYTFNDWNGDFSNVNSKDYTLNGGISSLNGNSPFINDDYGYHFNDTFNLGFANNTDFPVLLYIVNINPGDFSDLPGIDEILNDITNSYTFDPSPVFPNIDHNKTDIENEKSFFETLGNSITSSLNNLGNSLKTWFNNLMSKMVQGFNSVSQNIHNGFSTLMANIKDFFGAKLDFIIEKIEYITRPFDINIFTNDLNNSSFASSLLGLITSVQSFGNNFTAATEPNSCSFTLDFTNAYFNFGVCTFSFDWILPIRPIIRLFLGALCLYSLVISIFTSLNTYIGGTSSINDDI